MLWLNGKALAKLLCLSPNFSENKVIMSSERLFNYLQLLDFCLKA
jgi:hypothetical protein